MAQYFYDNQIRRFLIQFAKIFSNWYVTKGKDPNGNNILVRVPIQYGDSSRQASTIIANNSASNLPSAPLITYFINGLEYDQRRTQEPFFVEKLQVRQRKYNETLEDYETTQGQAFTVERLMPVPYTLRLQLDVWTTNYQQKLEIIEQLGTLFNPSLEIQSTDNYIDWTSLTVVYQDGLTFSSRSIPQGTGNPIDVLSWKFYLPIWLTTSAKLKKMGVINKVIASIFEGSSFLDMQDDDLLMGTRQKISPFGYKLLLLGNTLQLLPNASTFDPSNSSLETPVNPDTSIYWSSLLNSYGVMRPGISQIWLENPYMENEIVGTIVLDPLDDRYLIYNIDTDTLPKNTLNPVNSVINPILVGPNSGLPGSVNGVRYLLVEAVGSDSTAWGTILTDVSPSAVTETSPSNKYMIASTGTTNFIQIGAADNNPGTIFTSNNVQPTGSGTVRSVGIAYANDIIQYDSTLGKWFVAFDASTITSTNYVLNMTSGIQYRWATSPTTLSNNENTFPAGDAQWMKSYEGYYGEGEYSIVI